VRTAIELAVRVILGGSAGIGTIAYAVSIGPLVHFFLPRLSLAAPPGRPANHRLRAGRLE
jgi:uncharacterized membrane protein YczE